MSLIAGRARSVLALDVTRDVVHLEDVRPNSGRGLGNRLSMAVIFCVPRTVHTPRVSFEKRRDRPALGHFGDDRS